MGRVCTRQERYFPLTWVIATTARAQPYAGSRNSRGRYVYVLNTLAKPQHLAIYRNAYQWGRAWLDSTVSAFVAGESASARGLGRRWDCGWRGGASRARGFAGFGVRERHAGRVGRPVPLGAGSPVAAARAILPSANYTLEFDQSGPDWTA